MTNPYRDLTSAEIAHACTRAIGAMKQRAGVDQIADLPPFDARLAHLLVMAVHRLDPPGYSPHRHAPEYVARRDDVSITEAFMAWLADERGALRGATLRRAAEHVLGDFPSRHWLAEKAGRPGQRGVLDTDDQLRALLDELDQMRT